MKFFFTNLKKIGYFGIKSRFIFLFDPGLDTNLTRFQFLYLDEIDFMCNLMFRGGKDPNFIINQPIDFVKDY